MRPKQHHNQSTDHALPGSFARFRAFAAAAQACGRADYQAYQRQPELLPHLELGAFGHTSARALMLRRIMVVLRIPTLLLYIFGLFMRKEAWRREWRRFLHSYFYALGVRHATPDSAAWGSLSQPAVILAYHAFGQPADRFIVPARRFAGQMAWLKWRRYNVLSLEEYLRYRREHRLLPPRAVIITIDDGYQDNRTLAYPILKRYNFPATIFLVTQAVGTTNWWDTDSELSDRALLSWQDIHQMAAAGIHFGAHTQHHVVLPDVDPQRARDEISNSRSDLERELGVPCATFAFPYGRYNPEHVAAVEQAGYAGACVYHSGNNDYTTPLYTLHRLEVRGTDSLLYFALGLWLGDRLWERAPRRRRNAAPPRRSSNASTALTDDRMV